MSSLSTHVLDSVTGTPAAGMSVLLEAATGSSISDWSALGTAVTDPDGRLKSWGDAGINPGRYRLTFDTGAWFAERERECFYPRS